ncbi:MAG: sodium/solute symporter [bacterium]
MLILLDWLVIIAYMILIVGIALYLTRSQHDLEDYYLAGKTVKWWQSGTSTMATQLSAVSFVSAPAFVALKDGGGLKWLCYEFGIPLALILVMAIIIPTFHRRNYISIYEYLEERFDSGTRTLVSLLFQLGRGLATAVAVLAGGLILSTALAISTTSAIILIGVVTVIYDVLGGIRVVILSDVLQMMIIVVGIVICGGVALYLVGWNTGITSLAQERFQILDFKHWGVSAEGSYAFWPMLIGGIFLYASYYGCDQSQVQRELTVGNVDNVRKSLLVNVFGRFPLVLLYCFMGIFIGAVLASPGALSHVASVMNLDVSTVNQMLQKDPDRMVPIFIFSYLPPGIIGFIFVAIMAALMSSLDSGLNSLSAVTMRDFYQKYIKPDANPKYYLRTSKIITLFWGIFCLTAAVFLANSGGATQHTTIVLINAVGSLLYGPILAAFLLGMLTKWSTATGVKMGIAAGILVNIYLWIFTPVSWLWWNV